MIELERNTERQIEQEKEKEKVIGDKGGKRRW